MGQEPQWQQEVRQSRIFFVLLTPQYLASPLCLAQAAYAKQLGKACVIAQQHGTAIPQDFCEGFSSVYTYTWQTPKELEQGILRYLQEEGRANCRPPGGS